MQSLLLLLALLSVSPTYADIDSAPLGDIGFDTNSLTGARSMLNAYCNGDPCVVAEKNGVWYVLITDRQADLKEVYLAVGDGVPTFLLLWMRPQGIKLKTEFEIKKR